MKAAVRASRYYDSNPYAAESINKAIDELRIGAKLVIMVNKCPTFGGFSAACGGICPPGNKLTDCASGKVFTALASALASSSDYRWNKLEVLGENFRFSCPLTPPPLGRYESCPDATTIELSTLIDFYTIIVSGLCIAGVNMLLLSCAGITSKVHKKLISQVTVDEDIVKALLSQSQINRNDAPMNGQLVTCDEDSTRHLKCMNTFTSTTVMRQVDQMCLSVASMANCVEELAGIEKADEFAALVYDNEDLRFVTSCPIEIQALKTEYGHVEAAIATAMEARQANMTADETVQARQGTNRTFEEQVDSLLAYKAEHDNCHVPQKYKDDTVLASWVQRLRDGRFKLSEEQRQELTAMGFAWDNDEINASKRQQMILEVRLIVILLSLSHNFTNNLSHSGE